MILIASKTDDSAPGVFILGLIVIIYDCWVIYLTLTRWESFRSRHPRITSWGNHSWRFPASRVGVLYGALTGMLVGGSLLISGSGWRPDIKPGDWFLAGFFLWGIAGVSVALRDYFRHLDGKEE
jgi:hypothetical protein